MVVQSAPAQITGCVCLAECYAQPNAQNCSLSSSGQISAGHTPCLYQGTGPYFCKFRTHPYPPSAVPLQPCPFDHAPSAVFLRPCPFGHAPSATTRPKLAPTPKAATPIVAECKNPPTFATCRASVVADLNRSCVHNDQVSYCSLGTRKCSLATAHTRALTPSRDSLGSQSLQFSLPIHPPTSPPTNTTHSRAGALTQPRPVAQARTSPCRLRTARCRCRPPSTSAAHHRSPRACGSRTARCDRVPW
jgi:hypothetical protein